MASQRSGLTALTMNPLTPIQEFFKTESSSGVVLLVTTVAALLLANSPFSYSYFSFFQTHLTVGVSDFTIDKPLLLWINDGLMAVFFLLIGLEIKRELIYGELSDIRSAITPLVAAVGGVIVPGIIFIAFNGGTVYSEGWAIAIATDIAFAIGILSLAGRNVPSWAKVFLTTVAVADDLIAVMVIAVFYTSGIEFIALTVAGGCVVLLLILNRLNVRKLGFYLIVGLVLWVAVLKSGVHATVAGVILGLTIPASRTKTIDAIIRQAEGAVRLFRHAQTHEQDESRETALNFMEDIVNESESPLHRLEHRLHPWVAYGIIPVFAFANAGVTLDAELITEAFASSLTWGIVIGLFAGKQIGVFLSVYLMNLFGLGRLSGDRNTWKIVYGLACLCGVGFTMSLFIAGLSFANDTYLEYSKVGILLGSLLSGVLGYVLLRSAIKDRSGSSG